MPSSDATWLALLDEQKQAVRSSFNRLPNTDNARSFRRELELLCKKEGEKRPPIVSRTIIDSIYPIAKFSKIIEDSAEDLQRLSPGERLEGLVWMTSFALIEFGCKRPKHPLMPMVTAIAKLNKGFPHFPPETIRRFPEVTEVQQSLQNIYSEFLNGQLGLLPLLARDDFVKDEEVAKALDTYINDTNQRLEKARGEYVVMVAHAAEDEARRKADQEQPKLKQEADLPSLLHSHSGHTRSITISFVQKRILGRGSYGEVDEVAEETTAARYARKHIHLDPTKSAGRLEDDVKKEVAIMKKLRHRHIATVLFHAKIGNSYSIFMLPVANYDLKAFLKTCADRDFPEDLIEHIDSWFGCLLDALAYAHECKVKHQDIKPANILIKENLPYLSDFGLGKDFADLEESASRGERVTGSIMYRAPEKRGGVDRGRSADVFSLGCVYAEMFTITQKKSVQQFVQKRGSPVYRDCLPRVHAWLEGFGHFGESRLNGKIRRTIMEMIKEDPNDRVEARQAVLDLKRESALFCMEDR